MVDEPIHLYPLLIRSFQLRFDPRQEQLMTMLDKLYYDLQTYEPTTQNIQTTTPSERGNPLRGLFSKLSSALNISSTSADLIARPQSLYIYGGAGCGKVYSLKFVSLSFHSIRLHSHRSDRVS